jgi:transketolase
MGMVDKIATRQAYGEILVELGSKDENIVVLDADLSGSTMTKFFAKEFPERFFNVGVAEQNLCGIAAGIALSGKTVFASTFAMFAAGRAYEIVRNSIGYTSANVKICATHAGVTVGEDGGSHQCIEDLALMRCIPGMTVINPADAVSAKKLIAAAAAMKGPVYVRLGRAPVPILYSEEADVTIGKSFTLREGNDVTVIATGVLVSEAMIAAENLIKEGIDLRVIDMHTIKPIDVDAICKAARETKWIVTAEEHNVLGGLGGAVSEVLARHCPTPVRFVGVQDIFGKSGKPAELLEAYNMVASDIEEAVKELIGES